MSTHKRLLPVNIKLGFVKNRKQVERRSVLTATAGVLTAVSGCVGSADRSDSGGDATTEDCSAPGADAELASLLPPATEGRTRMETSKSDRSLSRLGDAVAGVRATYDDGDDDVLDDPYVVIYRFRAEQVEDDSEAASNEIEPHEGHQPKTATMELKRRLNSIAVNDGRAGTGALLGRVGFIAAAPDRSEAKELLARSPALSAECRAANEVSPSADEAYADEDETDSPKTVTEEQ